MTLSLTAVGRRALRSAIAGLVVTIAVAVIAFPGTAFAQGSPSTRIVLIPFDDVSGSLDGRSGIESRFAEALRQKGWEVVTGEDVTAILEAQRVRYVDSLDDASRVKLLEETRASAIVTGSILTYAGGVNPVVALSAKLVRTDGTAGWSDVRTLSADETEGLFGTTRRGSVESVAGEVVESMMRRFPKPGEEAQPLPAPGKRFLRKGPLAFRAADLDPSMPHLVCILPLRNMSASPDAARIVTDLLALRLAAASGFEVVDAARLRAAALAAGIASFRTIEPEDLIRLAPVVHTTLFLRGTVYDYVDPVSTHTREPRLQLELSLVDAESGRILWSAHHDRKGSDYTGLLMLGAATNSIALADRMIGEVIGTGTARASRKTDAGAAALKRRTPERHSQLRAGRSEEK